MTIIGNNNANSSSPLANTLIGAKDSDGSNNATSFMDIISMLSLNSGFDFNKIEDSELLVNRSESQKSISDLSLLKQFLHEKGMPTATSFNGTQNEPLANDTAAQFLAMLQKKSGSDFENFKVGEEALNADNLPADKVLINIAMKNVRGHFEKVTDITEARFEAGSVGEKVALSQNSVNATKVPQLSQFMINSSVFNDTLPKTVAIDFANIIEDAPISFDEFRISKIFTAFDNKENSSHSKAEVSTLDIIISPDFVDLSLENEGSLPVTQKVSLSENFNETNRFLAVSMEKPTSNIFITTIQAKHFRSEDSIPEKIYITFNKPINKSISSNTENNIKISLTSESSFHFSDLTTDTEHVALLTKVGSDNQNGETAGLMDFQIFKPKVTKDFFGVNNLPFINMEETTRSFSDRLATSLESVISGEFGSKQILQKLDSFLRKKDGETNLNKSLRSPIFDLLKSIKVKLKPALMSSTADVLSYKQAISANDKQVFDFQWIDAISEGPTKGNDKIFNDMSVKENLDTTSKTTETKFVSNTLVDTLRQSVGNQNLQIKAQPNMVNPGINPSFSTINLYDAHFSSRLSMLITDQIINGTENFELQLEPESFGKVRINVSLESSNVDVKMVADNSAAVLALRGSENILQNIAEQNGLKLSDYSVDMQNNQNGENSNRKNQGDEDEVNKSEHNKNLEENASAQNPDNTYSLNLLA